MCNLCRVFFPLTAAQQSNISRYMESHEGTDFIVTSGISDWAIKFKTGCRSEYVIIDVHGAE